MNGSTSFNPDISSTLFHRRASFDSEDDSLTRNGTLTLSFVSRTDIMIMSYLYGYTSHQYHYIAYILYILLSH